MALFGWLRRLFVDTADQPPSFQPSLPPIGLERPDAPDMVAPPPDPAPPHAASRAPAERAAAPLPGEAARPAGVFVEAIDEDVYGLTFSIEYEAADGALSRRRTMLRSISVREDGLVYLQALCFERKALRSFRLDRVRCVIDSDGVVFTDALAFLRDELRITIPAAGAATLAPRPARPAPPKVRAPRPVAAEAAPADPDKPGVAQRRTARDGLRVLAALARSDGMLHEAEVDAITDYIAEACAAEGVPCTAEDRAALLPYLRRQRPGLDVLEASLARLEHAPAAAQELLLRYAERVMMADGQADPTEMDMLATIKGTIAVHATT